MIGVLCREGRRVGREEGVREEGREVGKEERGGEREEGKEGRRGRREREGGRGRMREERGVSMPPEPPHSSMVYAYSTPNKEAILN